MKYLKFIVIAVLVLAPFYAHAQVFTKNLYFGLKSDPEVLKLQEFLTDEGIYTGPITGNFFSLTLRAVKSFQIKEGITPISGYFGPLTRTKANEKLSVELQESGNQAVVETGQFPPSAPSSTTQLQLEALLQQIALLQQQLNSQQQIQSQLQQQQQILGQIQQNTTPVIVTQPVVPEVRKEVSIEIKPCTISYSGTQCDIFVDYLENGSKVSLTTVAKITSSDNGLIAHYSGNKYIYYPLVSGIRTLTAEIKGITVTKDLDIQNIYKDIVTIRTKDVSWMTNRTVCNTKDNMLVGAFGVGNSGYGNDVLLKEISLTQSFTNLNTSLENVRVNIYDEIGLTIPRPEIASSSVRINNATPINITDLKIQPGLEKSLYICTDISQLAKQNQSLPITTQVTLTEVTIEGGSTINPNAPLPITTNPVSTTQ